MILRRLFIIFVFPMVAFSQTLARLQLVGQAEHSATELVGVLDVNGQECAAIQVKSDMEGFQYKAYNQVVRVDDDPGQDVVFLQAGERVLEIFHAGYEPLKLILSEIGIQLRPRQLWSIRVGGGKSKTTEFNITILTNPADAEIFIDGVSRGAGKQHTVSATGHELRIVKAGYQPEIRTISPDEKNTLFEFTLKAEEDVNFLIYSNPPGATVSLDGVNLPGKTLINAFYPAGDYQIRLEKEWYVPYQDSIEIRQGMASKTYTLQPDFASLTIISAPHTGLAIILNNASQQVSTPHTFERLTPGIYRLRARSDLFETDEMEIQLSPGDQKSITLHSSPSFATLNINTFPGATVYINEKKQELLKNIKLAPSVVIVRAEMSKAKSAEQRLVLRKGDSLTIDLRPDVALGTIQVAAVPVEAIINLYGDSGEDYTAIGAKIFKNIPIGTYILEVRWDGYFTHKESFVLHEGEKINKTVTLELLTANPAGAGIESAADRGKLVIKEMLHKMGGMEKMASVNNITYAAKLVQATPMGEMAMDAAITIIFPDKSCSAMKLPQGEIKMILNGDKGMLLAPQGSMPAPEPVKNNMIENLFRDPFMLARQFDEVEIQYAGESTFADKPAIEVIVAKGKLNYRLFIDTAALLPLGVKYTTVTQMGSAEVEERYEDYREVSGFQVAWKTLGFEKGKKASETNVVSVTFDGPVDMAIFKM